MRRILVVEDSAAMRGMIASIVDEIDDCEVVEVAGGFEALKQLPRDSYDLVISDINMPDINGLELLAFVRRSPHYQKTPVLLVTSDESRVQKERGMALGANAIMAKPFDADELLAQVKKLLGEG